MKAVRIGAVAVVAILTVAACQASVSPSARPTVSPTPTPAATASTLASPTATPTGNTLDGTITATLPEVPDWGTKSFPAMGRVRVTDPRVAGEYLSIISWGKDRIQPANMAVFRGVYVIWNEGGTWDGRFAGTIDASSNHEYDALFIGSGDYSGLRLLMHASAPKDDSVWTVSNTIERALGPSPTPPHGGPPGSTKVTGTRSCGTAVLEPTETLVGGVTQRRGEADVCTWSTSDARLAGPGITLGNLDLRPDGSASGWGSVSLQVGQQPDRADIAEGAWLGWYALERAADGTTTVTTSLVGFGAFEGFDYQDVQVAPDDTWTVTGWISPGP